MFTYFENQMPLITLSDEIIKNREILQSKWREMEDSYEKRDISTLLFADFSKLGIVDLTILADNISVYLHKGWRDGKFWKQHLDLASLLGAKNIGEFIMESKKGYLTAGDHEQILGYISLSSNKEWAIDFAKKMKANNMSMPDSIYAVCDDYDLLQDIKKVFFKEQPKLHY